MSMWKKIRHPVTISIGALIAGLTLMNAVVGAQDSNGVLEYRVTAVKGKLYRESPLPESQLEIGDTLTSGAVLKAGWFSSAELRVESHRSRFKISARSRVRLAGDRPGILLEVEKGRIHAIFDRLEGNEPPERIVVTPSAILAVRGTEYGLAVSRSGKTTLVVFEGTVEVRNTVGKVQTVLVPAGQMCTIQNGKGPNQPMPHSMGPGDWDRGQAPHSMGDHAPKDGSSSQMGGEGGRMTGSGHRG